jgi:hypothetical protein
VPTEREVLALIAAVPARYRAAIWVGAGRGLRYVEMLGLEHGPRCVDADHDDLHVVQQLRYSPKEYGVFYWWPKRERRHGVVGAALRAAAKPSKSIG